MDTCVYRPAPGQWLDNWITGNMNLNIFGSGNDHCNNTSFGTSEQTGELHQIMKYNGAEVKQMSQWKYR